MIDFRYGPVELYLVGFEGDRPAPAVMQALTDQLEGGLVRLLDFIVIYKDPHGSVSVVEIEDDADRFGLHGIELGQIGLSGADDIDELAPLIEPGTSAALVALELVYARGLASKVASNGGVLLSSERIPAPVVNALVDMTENEGA